jgi:hypothetical protein
MYYSIMPGECRQNIAFRAQPGERYRTESALYRAIVQLMNHSGIHHVVRQVPDRDGHMFGAPYYVRDRARRWCWYDDNYAYRGLHEAFNAGQEIVLTFFDMRGDE